METKVVYFQNPQTASTDEHFFSMFLILVKIFNCEDFSQLKKLFNAHAPPPLAPLNKMLIFSAFAFSRLKQMSLETFPLSPQEIIVLKVV